MEIPMRQVAGKVDDEGNTMLHMVGKRRKDYVSETVEGPGFVLQAELLWYERVKEVTVPHFLNHQNNKKFTAEGLSALTHNELRLQSKEWIKRTAEGCSENAVLISTVAFAAAYTVPGGSDEKTGFPILINHPFFVVFTISDVCALTLSLASVVTFLSILASPFRFQDFKHSLPNKLTLGFTFMFLSVTMMMVAFVATVMLMIKNKESWAKVALYTFSFIPIGIFALSYFPHYITTATSRACKYLHEKTKQLIPRNILVPLKKICCLSNRPKPGDTTSFIP
ncbi:ankyrin repeat-containing protein ITN1-like [Pistacia vera]|uniref:ankyrin repeat-containing protein ITN1-like n=1 Tax=Pistacia vera TaxID=55513 RepID=UPI001262E513|nr:ankyrin repeat-containing protein ITN1-like [Pistacia vera]